MPAPAFYLLPISLVTLLFLSAISLGTTSAATAAAAAVASSSFSAATCITRDQPNPLVDSFPNNVTGVLNVTLAILPIPLATARDLIPSQFPILESAYRDLLPDLPAGMYPVLLQAGHDHDIHLKDFAVDDFGRAGFEFPFVDLLGDGHTPFRWAPEQLIEASNEVAVHGSRHYGTVVHPAVFDPPCDAYGRRGSATYLRGVSGSRYMDLEFSPAPGPGAGPARPVGYPLSVYRALVNQPIFADPSGACDSMTRLFSTRLTTAPGFEPVAVVGRVRSNLGPFAAETEFGNVLGVHMATAFVENNFIECGAAHAYLGAAEPGDVAVPAEL